MNCYNCNTELIWGGDHDIDDIEEREHPIITNLSCPKCNAYVEVSWGDNKIEDTILSRLDKLTNDLKEIRKDTDRILNHSIFDGKENE